MASRLATSAPVRFAIRHPMGMTQRPLSRDVNKATRIRPAKSTVKGTAPYCWCPLVCVAVAAELLMTHPACASFPTAWYAKCQAERRLLRSLHQTSEWLPQCACALLALVPRRDLPHACPVRSATLP